MTEDVRSALVELGLSEDEADRAVREDRVPLALVDNILSRTRRHTVDEVATAAGVPAETLERIDRALGVPAGMPYDDVDMEQARLISDVLRAMSLEPLLRTLRADAQALTAMAMRTLELVRSEYILPIRAAGGDQVAVALTLAELLQTLFDVAGQTVAMSYRRILAHLIQSELVAIIVGGDVDHLDMAVGFVDVVGYTSLSARIDPTGLDEVIAEFEARVFEVTGDHPSVRLVKFLGDAAMLVSLDPVGLTHAIVELVRAQRDEGPLSAAPMKGGVSWGRVLVRGGDYYGDAVNLAARLTDRARPSTVLVSEELEDRLGAHFRLKPTKPMSLRGIGRRVPLAVRERLDDGATV